SSTAATPKAPARDHDLGVITVGYITGGSLSALMLHETVVNGAGVHLTGSLGYLVADALLNGADLITGAASPAGLHVQLKTATGTPGTAGTSGTPGTSNKPVTIETPGTIASVAITGEAHDLA